jgi:adenylosuccinate synthase
MSGKADLVIGAFYGDEGKGAVADRLVFGGDYRAVVRFQGGNNAGHTLVSNGETYKLHLIPCGIIIPDTLAIIGNGCVVDPFILKEEMNMLTNRGVSVQGLRISDLVHIIAPYHRAQDYIQEARRSVEEKIGSTCRGISPAYADKINRRGIRAEDLIDKDRLAKAIERSLLKTGLQGDIKEALDTIEFNEEKIFLEKSLDFDSLVEEMYLVGEDLKEYITNTTALLWKTLETDNVLCEGAQGIFLDIDFGSYPFVTSSSIVPGAINSGAGIPPNKIRDVYGVLKAFGTRIDTVGPFPTWDQSELAESLIDKGGEFGTTTGRRRRFGWLDLVAAKYAVNLAGINKLVVTKIDTLSGLEKIPVATGYEINGQVTEVYPSSLKDLAQAKAVYTDLPGWDEDVSEAREFSDLPKNAQNYINFIADFTGSSIYQIGVGPGREQNITLG